MSNAPATEPHIPQPVVLVLLVLPSASGPQVLLGMKLTGFGAGHIVAPGGKIEPGETATQAAVRELYEETGLAVQTEQLTRCATIKFRFPANPAADMDATVFLSEQLTGQIRPSTELDPRWYAVDALPVAQMWQDASHWLPRIIAGERFTATVLMARDNLKVQDVDFDLWP